MFGFGYRMIEHRIPEASGEDLNAVLVDWQPPKVVSVRQGFLLPTSSRPQPVAVSLFSSRKAAGGSGVVCTGRSDMDVWVEQALDGGTFPDQRLKARLGKLLSDLGQRIGEPLLMACQDWAATKPYHQRCAPALLRR